MTFVESSGKRVQQFAKIINRPQKSPLAKKKLRCTLWFLDGVRSSALFDRCIRRVGLIDAMVDGGECSGFFVSENEFTSKSRKYCIRPRLELIKLVHAQLNWAWNLSCS